MGPPADDPTGVDVLDERGERHARPRRDVGEVDDPQLVGPSRGEVALHQVRRPWFAPAFVSGFGLRIKQHLYGLRDTFRRVRDEHE